MSSKTVFIPVTEVASHLGVTPARVYQLVATGHLPAVRRGRRALIPRAAFSAYVEQMTAQALGNLTATATPENTHA